MCKCVNMCEILPSLNTKHLNTRDSVCGCVCVYVCVDRDEIFLSPYSLYVRTCRENTTHGHVQGHHDEHVGEVSLCVCVCVCVCVKG